MDRLSAAEAVEALSREYGKLVFHTIYGLTGDWEESQDLTQETFTQALKSIDAARARADGPFHAKAWLLRIALNTVRMQHRRLNIFRFIPFSRLQRQDKHSQGGFENDSSELNEQAAPVQPAGYGATEDEDPQTLIAERDAVQRTMARLSENLRVCLLLSVVGQFSIAEIAALLDLEEAAVRQRLARARKQFQQFYALESGEEVFDGTVPVRQGTRKTQPAHNPENKSGRVEIHLQTGASQPSPWRNHAERLYRDPAATPLW